MHVRARSTYFVHGLTYSFEVLNDVLDSRINTPLKAIFLSLMPFWRFDPQLGRKIILRTKHSTLGIKDDS